MASEKIEAVYKLNKHWRIIPPDILLFIMDGLTIDTTISEMKKVIKMAEKKLEEHYGK